MELESRYAWLTWKPAKELDPKGYPGSNPGRGVITLVQIWVNPNLDKGVRSRLGRIHFCPRLQNGNKK